jgi:hypothetical protein
LERARRAPHRPARRIDHAPDRRRASGGAPFAEELARLDTIRGVNKRTAEVLIAELCVDMTVFPTAKACR